MLSNVIHELENKQFYFLTTRFYNRSAKKDLQYRISFSYIDERKESILVSSEDISHVLASKTDIETGLLNSTGFHEKVEKWLEENPWQQRPYNDSHVFASAGAGLWTTANDQLKFYKMLMNLGMGDNGVRILKEETVKSILAVTTRPKHMGGYSLGLSAPVEDNEEAWFGHGGAWGTNCIVNWHKKQLRLWVVQVSGPQPWNDAVSKAAEKFFANSVDTKGVDAFTGRTK